MREEAAIRMAVRDSLRNTHYAALRAVQVQTRDGRVIRLSGAVRSYFQKQLAQQAVQRVCPKATIENCLTVR